MAKEARSYVLMLIGTFILGISFNAFLLPAKLAAGGVVGISTILYELYQWNPTIVQLSIIFCRVCFTWEKFQCEDISGDSDATIIYRSNCTYSIQST